jgi:uncharacterized phage-associated protein
MGYDPKSIANVFLALAEAEGKRLTPLQLIKLVYIAHGWYLALTSKPLIRESPEAWQYGPVIPSLYQEFKRFGNSPIGRRAGELSIDAPEELPPEGEDEGLHRFLHKIWNVYGKYTGAQLSTLTHKEGTPWHEVWYHRGGKDRLGEDIPDDLIREHYQQLRAKKNAGASTARD